MANPATVGICEACGKPVLNTQPRKSVYGPLDYHKYRGTSGGELDALVKQSGWIPNQGTPYVLSDDPSVVYHTKYGVGGQFEPPRLMHVGCS